MVWHDEKSAVIGEGWKRFLYGTTGGRPDLGARRAPLRERRLGTRMTHPTLALCLVGQP
jgi:hypothetical protein